MISLIVKLSLQGACLIRQNFFDLAHPPYLVSFVEKYLFCFGYKLVGYV